MEAPLLLPNLAEKGPGLYRGLWVIWGQCCPRVAAAPNLPNGPITQLSPYFTRKCGTRVWFPWSSHWLVVQIPAVYTTLLFRRNFIHKSRNIPTHTPWNETWRTKPQMRNLEYRRLQRYFQIRPLSSDTYGSNIKSSSCLCDTSPRQKSSFPFWCGSFVPMRHGILQM